MYLMEQISITFGDFRKIKKNPDDNTVFGITVF